MAFLLLLTGIMLLNSTTKAQVQKTLEVFTKKPAASISPTMWGIFFEDINFSADGGLYAELVKNRSFEFSTPKMGWKQEGNGNVLINNRLSSNANNPHYAAITINGTFRLTNEGFRGGMGVKAGEQYNFSALEQLATGSNTIKISLKLLTAKGETIGETNLPALTNSWQKIEGSFKVMQTVPNAKLQLVFEGNGTVNMDMISLFPKDTWKGRPGGMRKDLVQLLADLKPGFVRFPGGCIVEGRTLDNRYQWKKTIGPIDQRESIINRWNTEFSYRSTPDYFQSFGLGFYEYFQLAEDIGAQPLPILNCGMACQYNSGEVAALTELDPFIQDALDLVEFANGDTTTQWGRLRNRMGHPAPFNLTMMGVGNEQWDTQYLERYQEFEKALKQRYPAIKLVAAAGPSPNGKDFDFAWKELSKTKVDFLDEHYYQSPSWFLNNASRYDNYDRKGPKVFAGEYASHDKEGKEAESKNTWLSALTEAAFMTGLERNADVVNMAAYAPLFAHVEAWQWRPDLIWFDNLKSMGTPNYYVQKLYSNNKGTTVVPILQAGKVVAGSDSLYASAALDNKTRSLIVKLVNVSAQPMTCIIQTDDKKMSVSGTMQVLSSEKTAINTLNDPTTVSPKEQTVKAANGTIQITLEPLSLSVIRIPADKSNLAFK